MISVVGAGLAGSLLALELAKRGCKVRLIDADTSSNATALSYGLMPWSAAAPWRRLQRRHGDLGLRLRWLQLGHSRLPVPALQIDPQVFTTAMAAVLPALGVERQTARLAQLPEGGTPVVLACGAGCRDLAPVLDGRLLVSWAGILELTPDWAGRLLGWRAGIAQLPERFARLELERRAPSLEQETWIVDGGLVPCGDRLLAGQISLVRPGLKTGDAPDSQTMEQRLRQALAQRWPQLAQAPGRYRQVPVSFCSDGIPLAGPAGDGLWVLAGFSGAFSQIPAAARCLADQLAAN